MARKVAVTSSSTGVARNMIPEALLYVARNAQEEAVGFYIREDIVEKVLYWVRMTSEFWRQTVGVTAAECGLDADETRHKVQDDTKALGQPERRVRMQRPKGGALAYILRGEQRRTYGLKE